MDIYPANCRHSIRRLTDEIGVDAETAYRMMLMTSAFMDLQPDDKEVVNIILEDCGIEVRA